MEGRRVDPSDCCTAHLPARMVLGRNGQWEGWVRSGPEILELSPRHPGRGDAPQVFLKIPRLSESARDLRFGGNAQDADSRSDRECEQPSDNPRRLEPHRRLVGSKAAEGVSHSGQCTILPNIIPYTVSCTATKTPDPLEGIGSSAPL